MAARLRYKDAGVDIEAGEEAVDLIKEEARSTFSPNVLTDLGKFGGFFTLDIEQYKSPVLVSSIDGVGTKLKIAFMTGRHDTVGEDLVNHCINDILVGGARPLFFLDYIGTGKLTPSVIKEIVSGMARACRDNRCSLIGGEMAEMPGFYREGEYDIAGCIVGIVEKDRIIDGSKIRKQDIVVGLSSNGLHTNGYSLARKVLFEIAGYKIDDLVEDCGMKIGEALLQVHKCYLRPILPLLDTDRIKGMAHITGGGIVSNTNRLLPEGRRVKVFWNKWQVPEIFNLIQRIGKVPDEEMRRTFNMGIGFVLIISPDDLDYVIDHFKNEGEKPVVIGHIE